MAAAAQLLDPFRAFRFHVEISGVHLAAFAGASVPDITIDKASYREGTDPLYQRHLSGLASYGVVSLKKGLSKSYDLYSWVEKVSQLGSSAPSMKKNVSLVLMDPAGTTPVAQWDLVNAWPSGYQTSGMDAATSEVMIETLELTIEYMTRKIFS